MKERDRQTDRQTDRDRETETHKDRDRETETHRERERERSNTTYASLALPWHRAN